MAGKPVRKEMIDDLVQALGNDNVYVRNTACKVLGMMGEKAATKSVIDGLVQLLGDVYSHVRNTACEVLGKMGEKAAIKSVIDRLAQTLGDEDLFVGFKASKVLENMGEKAAMEDLIDGLVLALGNENEVERGPAVSLFDNIVERRPTMDVIDRVVRSLSDEYSRARYGACVALQRMGKKAATKDVIDRLLQALDDEHSDVRDEACGVLVEMGEKAVTKEVIERLVNIFSDCIHGINDYSVAKFVEKVLSSSIGLNELESLTISKLFSLMRYNQYMTVESVPFDNLIKWFFQTGESAWVAVIIYGILLQGSGITVIGNRIMIYGMNEPVAVTVCRTELLTKLVSDLEDQTRRLQELCLSCKVSWSLEARKESPSRSSDRPIENSRPLDMESVVRTPKFHFYPAAEAVPDRISRCRICSIL
jgi:HEAT repeat protein